MSSSPSVPGNLRTLWHRWKALRLPWRRRFLVGADLAGNTFWEFKDALNANRWRRIAKHPRSTHYADVRISPQWHQWLRHTREDPPSIEEQQMDVSRRAMLKELAAQADERWKSIPSYLSAPSQQQQPQPAPGVEKVKEHKEHVAASSIEDKGKDANAQIARDDADQRMQSKLDASQKSSDGNFGQLSSPWSSPQRGAPSENWQPESWTPGAAQRR